ncbi:hypothetical protein WN943_003176 [Citrus x changshan-huyou]
MAMQLLAVYHLNNRSLVPVEIAVAEKVLGWSQFVGNKKPGRSQRKSSRRGCRLTKNACSSPKRDLGPIAVEGCEREAAVKVGGLSDETCVKGIREMAETNLSINKASSKVDDQSFVSNENHHMAILRRKMEGLSNGTLLERMNDEYGSMLLSMANSSAASSVPTPKRTEIPNVSSSPKEHPCKPRPPKHQHCRHKLQILVSSHKKKAIITDLFKVKDERVEINLLGEEQVFFATFILFWKSSLANFQVLHNTCKIKVVEEKSQDQRKDLYENEKSKADLVEEAMSLMESSKTHFKSLRSPKNAKEMDIDTSWEKLRN